MELNENELIVDMNELKAAILDKYKAIFNNSDNDELDIAAMNLMTALEVVDIIYMIGTKEV